MTATPIANMVERLIAAATPPALAATVVAEAFAAGVSSVEFRGHSADETAERRRAKDRDRKRLLRGNPRTSADIPRNSTTALNLTSSPSKDSEVQKEGKKVRARKSFLSAEFQPKSAHFEAAEKLNYPNPRQAVFDKTEDMKVWAHGKGEARADWDATLHGFLRRDASKSNTGHHNAKSGIIDAADRAIESLRQRETADSGTGFGGAPPFRLVP